MSKLLDMPHKSRNLLMAAFQESKGSSPTPKDELAKVYVSHFALPSQSPKLAPTSFERLSLTNPNIKIVVQSNTVPA